MGMSKQDLETFRRLHEERTTNDARQNMRMFIEGQPTFLRRPTQRDRGKWIEVPSERHPELSTAAVGVLAFVFLVGCIAGYLAGLVRLVGPF